MAVQPLERPNPTEYAEFYSGYVSEVTEADVLELLERQLGEIQMLAAAVPAERETFRYAPGKWSIREVVGHLADGERVFGYRAYCISRGERQALPGFDEQQYVIESGSDRRALADLVGEFSALRRINLILFRSLEAPAWRRIGNANGSLVSVRALAYIMAGHVRHHFGVLRSRYNIQAQA